MEINGKVVLITGSGKGIGRGIALAFAKENANLLIADVNENELEKTKRMIEKSGAQVIAVATDVTQYSDVMNMYNIVMKEYGRLDIVINNAGTTNPRGLIPLVEHTNEEYQRIIDVNLKGIFFSCKEAVKRMKKDSIIINVSSGLGLWGMYGASVYGASKLAIIGLSKCLAKEFKGKIYIVMPPATNTDLYRIHHPEDDPSKLKKTEEVGKDIIGLCKSDVFDSGSIICVWGSPASPLRIFIRKIFSPLRRYLKKYFKTNLYIENPAFHSMGGYVKYVDPDQIKANKD